MKSYLSYLDISVGQKVAGFPTGLGKIDVMCQNPRNAIIHLGHSKGISVKLFCARSSLKRVLIYEEWLDNRMTTKKEIQVLNIGNDLNDVMI